MPQQGTIPLNTPPTIMEEMPPANGAPPGMPGAPPMAPQEQATQLPPQEMPQMPSGPPMPQSMDEVNKVIAQAHKTPQPTIDEAHKTTVHLPGGWLINDGRDVVDIARVRELNGFDEERLSRMNFVKNQADYVTTMIEMACEDLAGMRPSKLMARELLIGDRDALVLGIREATYGPTVEFTLTCFNCEEESLVTIGLDEIEVVKLEDPLIREWDVPLRAGSARVRLLTGADQDTFGDMSKRTSAEISSIMLARSVMSINGVKVQNDANAVRALPAADRMTLRDFNTEHQPGPKVWKPIPGPCANCGEETPITLGWNNLFPF